MTIKKLEDLETWQEARKFSKGIYILTKNFPKQEEYLLKKHLRESARGGMANIAEGFGRYFYRESLKFYDIAMGCLEEVRSDLYLCLDVGYINKETFNRYLNQLEKVEAKLNGLISSTNKRIKIKPEDNV